MKRRNFLFQTGLASAGIVTTSSWGNALSASAGDTAADIPTTPEDTLLEEPLPEAATLLNLANMQAKSGLGGVAIGNGFQQHSDLDALHTMEAAWKAGVRHFDTSPWYGLGISERRMGIYLKDKPRKDFVLTSKIGRILQPEDNFQLENGLWKGKLNFNYSYDYSADGARRSVEDSLQRLGVASLDYVYIHDLSPDNGDMKEEWTTYFDQAAKGAMPELSRMREEGLIKGWGFGVNTIDPIIKAMEVSDPDVFLSACQYSLIKYEQAWEQIFPLAKEKGVKIVVGAPLCAGYLAGKDRYLYSGEVPAGVAERRAQLLKVAANHGVDLRTAALQFSAAPDEVLAVIPGASSAEQAAANAASFEVTIPNGFWQELKREKLLRDDVPTPS